MDVIKVEGGATLSGTVWVEGAKNSALKLMAATIMAPGVYHLTRIPDISDVHLMARVLETLGATVLHGDHEVTIDTTHVDKWTTPYELVSRMRASISVLGPLLVRFGRAVVAMPVVATSAPARSTSTSLALRPLASRSRTATATSTHRPPRGSSARWSRWTSPAWEPRRT